MSKEEYFFKEGCYITELLNTSHDPEVSVAQARVEPGQTTRWHSLANIHERYLILQGKGIAEIGTEKPQAVRAGDVIQIPAGCQQRITNTGTVDLLFLAVCTPRFVPEAYQDLEEFWKD